uniref:Uncharacterized protein n=1 Tax=Guillardia theta TaxID=55529 RepID=A0A7S4PG37_GUITH|mmetsp:Transcript_50112/g.156833  ORF Transcript_50112/g.156833 Transcript_50112/m.156833 type:complete len:149 (+) Transcript_50112:72-518(+)
MLDGRRLTINERAAKLFTSAGCGDYAAVQEVLEQDKDLLREVDHDGLFAGWNCLHWCAQQGHVEVAKLLMDEAEVLGIESPTLVDMQDKEGDTPLHIAVSWGHAELARMMISRNADVKIRNDKRKTALDLATEGFRKQLKEFARISSA